MMRYTNITASVSLLVLSLLPIAAQAQYLDGLPVASSLSPSDVTLVCQGGTAGHPGTCTPKQTTVGAFQETATGSFASLNVSGASNLSTVQSLSSGGLSVVANSPLQGIYATGGGSLIDMCPGYDFGCPSLGKIRSQQADIFTTLGDAGTQESGLYVYMKDTKGEANNWQTSTAYVAGQSVLSNGYAYLETAASCVSAGSGGGPSGTGSGIIDGTCLWNASGVGSLVGKINIASTILALPGGGNSWGGAFDNFLYQGYKGNFATALELDVTNNSGQDPTPGGSVMYPLLYLGGSVGTKPITAYVHVSPFGLNGTNYMSYEGLWFDGSYTIKNHDIRISTNSASGIFLDGAGTHSTSGYFDGSTAPNGILLEGNYTSGVAEAANATIQSIATKPGSGLTGFNVTNLGTTPTTTTASVTLNTGNTNSFVREDLFDSSGFSINTGSALTSGLTLSTAAGPINLNPTTTIKVNGTTTFTGTKTAGSCTFTIVSGLITNVTGC